MASRRNLRISLAIAASLGVHFAAAMAMTPSGPKVEIEGGATADIAALGSSFEDLLAGTSAAQPAEVTSAKTAEPVAEPVTKPAQPDKTAEALPEKPRQSAAREGSRRQACRRSEAFEAGRHRACQREAGPFATPV